MMATTSVPNFMRELPHSGQRVGWRNPRYARAWSWESLFGPGPFEVVGLIGRRGGLAAQIVISTNIGEQEIPEVWLALCENQESGEESKR